jgi:hypothetical protein
MLIGMIRFIYCEDIDLTEDVVLELLQIADKYTLDGLVKLSEDFLINTLKVSNCVRIVIAAEELNNLEIKEAALKFIKRNIQAIKTRRDGIDNLSKTILIELLSRAKFSGIIDICSI